MKNKLISIFLASLTLGSISYLFSGGASDFFIYLGMTIFFGYLTYYFWTKKSTKEKPEKSKSTKKSAMKKSNFPKDFTIIDFETTGLHFTKDEIIEIGAIKVRDLKIISEFNTFCNPYMPIENSQIHGITDDDVKDYMYPIEYMDQLMDFIGDDIIFAYNAPFDGTFLNSYLPRDVKNKFFDVLNFARNNDFRDSYKLENVKKDLGIRRISHRAVDDCRTTLQYYIYLINNRPIDSMKFVTFHKDLLKIRKSKETKYCKIILENYKPNTTSLDKNNKFYKQKVCFTGNLKSMNRPDAFKKILDCGGEPQTSLNLKTNYLVVGDFDWETEKLKRTTQYNEKDEVDISIIDEKSFLEIVY